MTHLSIIVPTYNEAGSIGRVLAELQSLNLSISYDIVWVDDASTDGTERVISQVETKKVQLLRNMRNLGYGASLKRGIRSAKGDFVLLFDGDGQFSVQDIPMFVDKALAGDVDFIMGMRKKGSAGSPLWRKPGKYFIRFLVRYLLGQRLEDINCGFRLFRRTVILRYLHLCSDRFSFSTSSTVTIISRGYSFMTVPVHVRPRISGTSSVTAVTGFDTILLVIRLIMLFNPLKFFLPFGIIFITFGTVWGGWYVLSGYGLSVTGLLFIIVGILAVFLGLIADQISELRKSQFEHIV